MHKILRKHQPKIRYRWAVINQSLRNNVNICLYIQPLETCLAFSCPLILCPSISCQAISCLKICLYLSSIFMSVNFMPGHLVCQFYVRQIHAWTFWWSGIFMSVIFSAPAGKPMPVLTNTTENYWRDCGFTTCILVFTPASTWQSYSIWTTFCGILRLQKVLNLCACCVKWCLVGLLAY